jgi:serine/threonine protein kinase
VGNPIPIHRLTSDDLPVRFGHYEILELLGQGGMARVFRAEKIGPRGFRKQVALKVITDRAVCDDDRLRRSLLNEARLGAQLNHHNLVDVYDYGEEGDQPFIAMQLVEGSSLDRVLEDTGPLPPAIALRVAIDICRGLQQAHTAAIVHRDLKPSNVILSNDGIAKLADLGIAKALQSPGQTTTDSMKGTPGYMAPEQIAGQAVDHRTDIFALGVLLYELFTGKRAISGTTAPQVVWSIMNIEETIAEEDFRQPLEGIDPELAATICACLRQDPEDRIESAAALASRLERVFERLPPGPDLTTFCAQLPHGGPRTDTPLRSSSGTTGVAPSQTTMAWSEDGDDVALDDSLVPEPMAPTRPSRAGLVAALALVVLLPLTIFVLRAFIVGGETHIEPGSLQDIPAPVLTLHVPRRGQTAPVRISTEQSEAVRDPNWIGYHVNLHDGTGQQLRIEQAPAGGATLVLDRPGVEPVGVHLQWCRCVTGCAGSPRTECFDLLEQVDPGTLTVAPDLGVGPLALLDRGEIEARFVGDDPLSKVMQVTPPGTHRLQALLGCENLPDEPGDGCVGGGEVVQLSWQVK